MIRTDRLQNAPSYHVRCAKELNFNHHGACYCLLPMIARSSANTEAFVSKGMKKNSHLKPKPSDNLKLPNEMEINLEYALSPGTIKDVDCEFCESLISLHVKSSSFYFKIFGVDTAVDTAANTMIFNGYQFNDDVNYRNAEANDSEKLQLLCKPVSSATSIEGCIKVHEPLTMRNNWGVISPEELGRRFLLLCF
ncbi:hypothetical protein CEXT_155721 [Caerostris extrusa]|uniref:Uncharacterized protein n=1 Tax=Caerostris extrusa TaxID=172846 RepID=A0AAV4MR89_CAEEX|nr:hypothetical protein CEXT_155721 [Caerostris extrusa]